MSLSNTPPPFMVILCRTMSQISHTWIIGCGDIGRRVSKLYKTVVSGIVQSENSVSSCKESINAYKVDLDLLEHIDKKSELKGINGSNLYYFAPPPSVGELDTRLNNFLNVLSASQILPKRIVLISTTGVYGDSKGEWIDETTVVHPVADRAKRRLHAERCLQKWATHHKVGFLILRVPGIYAENRLPLTRLRKGLPIVNEAEAGYTNRIHADDLAMICKTAMDSQISNEIINVSDGNPSTMTSYFNHVADYSGLPRPPQISLQEAEATLSSGMVSYLKESRRIKNDKLLKLLKIKIKYPDLSSALPLLPIPPNSPSKAL